MAKKNKIGKKNVGIIAGACVAVVAVIAIIVGVVIANSKPKEIELSTSQSVSVSSMVVAVARDRLDSSGSITPGTCDDFRALAKAYNDKTDWFKKSYCDYLIYADYSETENALMVTLSDGAHAAIYMFSIDRRTLLNYKFIESTAKGRTITINAK